MSITNSVLSSSIQLIVFGGAPFFIYLTYHRWRHKRTLTAICKRAGLQIGQPRYLLYSLVAAAILTATLIIWTPPLEPLIRKGSAQSNFAGLGITMKSVTMALLYGVVKTGFTEELLFRGLIAGSLSRRLSVMWANLIQALIFLLPHLAVLLFAPELWTLLPAVFAIALVLGWIRIKSGSMIGPWILHSSGNVAFSLIVAARTLT